MAENQFGAAMESMFKGMDQFITSKTVVGDVIKVDAETSIIPLVDVSFGLGAGANVNEGRTKNFGGGGMGAKLSPTAVMVIQKGTARIIDVKEPSGIVHLVETAPDLVTRVMNILHKDEKLNKAVDEAFDNMDLS